MPLGYIIPGAKKYIHQGSTVSDAISTPGVQNINAQLQGYENLVQANRYITSIKMKATLSIGASHLDLFIPKLRLTPYPAVIYPISSASKFIDQPTVIVSQDIFNLKEPYPYPVIYPISSGYKYIDSVPLVQSNQQIFGFKATGYNPIPYFAKSGSTYIDLVTAPAIPDIFRSKQNPYPGVNYSIPPQYRYIDTGAKVQSNEQIFGFRSASYNPIIYPVKSGYKYIDVSAILSQDVFVRKNVYYPALDYRIPKISKFVDVLPYTNQQTYIFPLPKPIQEWYTRLDYNRYIRKVVQILDNLFPVNSGNALIACVDTSISWENHFITNAWTDIQDQISAGFLYYAEPSKLNGSYQEVFDFGSIISNIIAVVNWNQTSVDGSVVTSSTTLETSTDGITWSAPTVGTSVFAASLRYVRLTMNFVGATTKSLSIYNNLQCLLNVHREQDGGQANVFAADVGGTVVTFNKAFKALDALTVTPISTVEQKAVYDFSFPVNPTTFKVLLFNAAGARIDGLITWVARGIF